MYVTVQLPTAEVYTAATAGWFEDKDVMDQNNEY